MSVHASIEPLAWESAFFALHSGRLRFCDQAPPLQAAACDAYQLVQAKVPADDLACCDALYALGFRLAEGEVDFVLPVQAASPSGGQRPARVEDCLWLRALAREAFALSRFRAPWYHPQDSGRFYAEWVEKAVYGTFDHACLLALDDAGSPQGFVTVRALATGAARIGLLAVARSAARRGVGRRLVAQAQAWCQTQQLSHLSVATQIGNLAAQRLYLGCGARLDATAYWLYR
ncbi:TDP-D-fucosamine acetyltransferase [Edwardsiella hoshinae]|uniref:dTDP-fucosamine acetyltransferase n=1 Tax=Edwardsiella hoshinae TaxID=93378 RepID=A0ABN4T128_9GAMM|nr:dTDP-4-amino-4,6-dideoxy-D-galactose acyltransferase [Edwardsiella hoshinae]AOV98348.1 TDP-D-fucosamine acetyltransferase [Edwardsiella hoshinae]